MRYFFTTTWANEQRMAGAPSVTYDSAATTYDSASTTYDGQALPVWTNETRNT